MLAVFRPFFVGMRCEVGRFVENAKPSENMIILVTRTVMTGADGVRLQITKESSMSYPT